MHEVKINNTVLQIPSCWNELTRKNLELIAGLSAMKYRAFKAYLLFFIAGIRISTSLPERNPDDRSEQLYQVKLQNGEAAFLSAGQVDEISNLFNFLFRFIDLKDGKTTAQIDSHLTINKIPHFTVSGKTYYGPAEKLFNITMSEFIHAETNLARYLKAKDDQFLDRLIAILWRPQKNPINRISGKFDGDRRVPFNDHKFEKRAIKISKLNSNTKMAILFFYQGCQGWYQNQFPHVFKGGKKSSNNLGFLNLVDALTGGDVTKIEDIRKSYLMDVMVHLERAAVEYEEMEAKLKKK